jgi:hypothetical protein
VGLNRCPEEWLQAGGRHLNDKEKAAFFTGQGLCQFTVMSFGLYNASATFD